MVALPDNGANAYYHRVADGTARIPEYLLSDLLFGRRQRAFLRVADYARSLTCAARSGANLALHLKVEVFNDHVAWAEGLYGGILFADTHSSQTEVTPTHPLFARVAWDHLVGSPRMRRLPLPERLAPLAATAVAEAFETVPRPPRTGAPTAWQGALFIGTASGPPQWWELRARVPRFNPDVEMDMFPASLAVTEVFDRLPVVRAGEVWSPVNHL